MMPSKPMDTLDHQVPQLPARSSRRVTTLLASLPHKIDAEEQTVLSQATPHEHNHYLSSEEDASSSADELSDYSFDSDDEDLSPMSTERPAIEQVTARAVSVVYSGKPSIVQLPRRSASPSSSTSSSSMSPSRPASRSTDVSPPTNASFAKRMSIMSFRSATITSGRPNSMLLDAGEQHPTRPNFLDSDPFPSVEEPTSSRTQSKTPGTMLKRTFNLVKRRSRSRLNQSASLSRDDLSLADDLYESRPAFKLHHSSTAPMGALSPTSPSKLRTMRDGLTMSRRKSVKA